MARTKAEAEELLATWQPDFDSLLGFQEQYDNACERLRLPRRKLHPASVAEWEGAKVAGRLTVRHTSWDATEN